MNHFEEQVDSTICECVETAAERLELWRLSGYESQALGSVMLSTKDRPCADSLFLKVSSVELEEQEQNCAYYQKRKVELSLIQNHFDSISKLSIPMHGEYSLLNGKDEYVLVPFYCTDNMQGVKQDGFWTLLTDISGLTGYMAKYPKQYIPKKFIISNIDETTFNVEIKYVLKNNAGVEFDYVKNFPVEKATLDFHKYL